ncbi:MAG: rhomboid family intramembrane serine protease [Pseudomonadota bacterium]
MDLSSESGHATPAPVHPVLWVLTGIMVALHLLEMAAARGYVNSLFSWFYLHSAFGFFDAYFDRALAGESYPMQLYWSVVTHGFLHGGLIHLGMNCAVFLAIGHTIARTAGVKPMLVCFFTSVIAGALFFGLIAKTEAVLIGASGGVFGLLGMLTGWREMLLRSYGLSRAPVWRLILGLAAVNLLFAFGTDGFGGGQLAWEAHLGGFACGWILSRIYPPPHPGSLPGNA